MTAQPLDPMPVLPEVDAIHTYGPGYWTKTLCLATRHDPGDPMPVVCAREVHPHDGRHVSVVAHVAGVRYEQTVWTDGDE